MLPNTSDRSSKKTLYVRLKYRNHFDVTDISLFISADHYQGKQVYRPGLGIAKPIQQRYEERVLHVLPDRELRLM